MTDTIELLAYSMEFGECQEVPRNVAVHMILAAILQGGGIIVVLIFYILLYGRRSAWSGK